MRGKAAMGLWLTFLTWASSELLSQAAYYQVGQVVTNFTLHSRYRWTNSAAKVEIGDHLADLIISGL